MVGRPRRKSGSPRKEEKWPGVGDRIKQAIARKYWKNGKPDISGFSVDNKFIITYVYKWCNGETTPDRENLFRLGEALDVPPAWLLFGDDAGQSSERGGRARPVPTSTPPTRVDRRGGDRASAHDRTPSP
jgi:helix-turn-helix protein